MPKDKRTKQTDAGLHKRQYIRSQETKHNLGATEIGVPYPKVGGRDSVKRIQRWS